MLKRPAIVMTIVGVLLSFAACNSDTTYDVEYTYASTLVKSFKLQKNDKLLAHLDSVFFSIDLVNAEIFNADSLPFGTNVSKIPVTLTTDNCSVIELTFKNKEDKDTTINYLTNSSDSINFAKGPVKLHLVSYDGEAKRDYTIRVNVHRVQPDQLIWNRLAMRKLPTTLSAVKAQKSVKLGNTAVCLTTDGSAYCIATSADPSADNWKTAAVTFGFTPDLNSLAATVDALYILADDGAMYKSNDLGANWTATGETWLSIYGGYGSKLLGVEMVSGKAMHVTYPAGAQTDVPVDCPVRSTGTMVTFSNKWAIDPQAMFAGGITADGNKSKSVWGYDGTTWACISDKLPLEMADASLFSYRVGITDSINWSVREVPALFIIGAPIEKGKMTSKVYISRDMGITWRQGDAMMQLPDYIAPRTSAQPLVFDTTIKARSGSDAWQEFAPREIPMWWEVASDEFSRATSEITSWECPYIYLFGGISENGNLYDSVWKGVINRLTFKPLQ